MALNQEGNIFELDRYDLLTRAMKLRNLGLCDTRYVKHLRVIELQIFKT
jgi:hypothetical protein